MALRIRKLEPADDLRSFETADGDRAKFLRQRALANQGLFGATYVEVDDEAPNKIRGFITVVSGSINREDVGKPTAPRTIPMLLIGQLATDKTFLRQGVATRLLARAFQLAADQYETTGCALVVVDSVKTPEATAFYEKNQFRPILNQQPTANTIRMYVEMDLIRAAMGRTKEATSG